MPSHRPSIAHYSPSCSESSSVWTRAPNPSREKSWGTSLSNAYELDPCHMRPFAARFNACECILPSNIESHKYVSGTGWLGKNGSKK